ncbi:MAG: AI-2E family transporter [Oscillospiraceae bacterium]|jgi:predicted PurR-regulated permease PerM|nr:AI-2E family transporter [Oscillospiraceae bacterium]
MSKFKWDKKYLYWGLTALVVILACLAVFWIIQRWSGIRAIFKEINTILTPIIWGLVIAYLLTPLVKLLERVAGSVLGERIFKKNAHRADNFGRGFSVTLAIVALLGAVALLLWIVLPALYNSIRSIISNLDVSVQAVVDWANTTLAEHETVNAVLTDLLGNVEESLTKWANEILPEMNELIINVSIGVFSVIRALMNFFIAVVASVYIMYNRERFAAQSKRLVYSVLPLKQSNNLLNVLRFTNKSFMGYFAGQLLDALAVGVLCYLGCLLIGIKDAVLIAIIIGVTNIIPFFGPFIGAIPSALIVLMYSPLQCLIFVLFIIVLQQFDGNILAPKILGNATGLSGFWVMFAIIVGAGLLGPVGMIIGVPLFVVIYAAIRYLVQKQLKKRGLPLDNEVYIDLDHIDPETRQPVKLSEKTDQEDPAQSSADKAPWHDKDN